MKHIMDHFYPKIASTNLRKVTLSWHESKSNTGCISHKISDCIFLIPSAVGFHLKLLHFSSCDGLEWNVVWKSIKEELIDVELKEKRESEMARGSHTRKTEQCHHQTDAIMKPLGKQKGRYIQDKLETQNTEIRKTNWRRQERLQNGINV